MRTNLAAVTVAVIVPLFTACAATSSEERARAATRRWCRVPYSTYTTAEMYRCGTSRWRRRRFVSTSREEAALVARGHVTHMERAATKVSAVSSGCLQYASMTDAPRERCPPLRQRARGLPRRGSRSARCSSTFRTTRAGRDSTDRGRPSPGRFRSRPTPSGHSAESGTSRAASEASGGTSTTRLWGE